jgi:hypothetical protein
MRKKNTLISIACVSLLFTTSCDVVQDVANTVITSPTTETKPSLTNEEVIRGLKDALSLGIENATALTSKTDGFLKNAEITIPWPEDALVIKEKAEELGLNNQVNTIVTTLNRAAEEAAKEAGPIFLKAIREMSVQDGFAILNGGEGAATNFLKDKTFAQLKTAFSPKVNEAIEKVELTKYWTPIITRYNQTTILTGAQKMDPDINEYVLNKAIGGLFLMVEKEENKIRKDPAARVTELLQRVFGSIIN